jgi:hypothetical protein
MAEQHPLEKEAAAYIAGRRKFDELHLMALRSLPLLAEVKGLATELARTIVHNDARRSAGDISQADIDKSIADLTRTPQRSAPPATDEGGYTTDVRSAISASTSALRRARISS